MKCHIGVDAGSGLVHTITVTAANAHDITQAAALIREDDEVVYGDSGYLGIQRRPEVTRAMSTYPELTTALTAVPASCLVFLIRQLTGNGISKIADPQCAAKWSMHSGSSNVNLATRKQCTAG